MSIDSIKYRAQAAFAGDLTRPNAPFTTIPKVTSSDITFGAPVVEASGKVRAVLGTDTAISGFAVRSTPIASHQYPNAGINEGGYITGQVIDVIKDGYIAVKVLNTTEPALGGKVFVRVVAATGLPIGSIEAVDDGANTFEVVGAVFNSNRDASGIAEIHLSVL